MPTPDAAMLSPPAEEHESYLAARCPDESHAHTSHNVNSDSPLRPGTNANVSNVAATPPMAEQDSLTHAQHHEESNSKGPDTEVDGPIRDIPTPTSATEESAEEARNPQVSPVSAQSSTSTSWSQHSMLASPCSSRRLLPNSSSSFLRNGSKFKGNQTSDRQQYEVEVEIKHVDMRESFLCGYLRIKGLTEDHPSLTTYFEGEIIGNKYGFITAHPEWGSNEKVDRQHWARFSAYKPLSKFTSRPDLVSKDWMQKDHIFMRWKEYFLVPDHRVRTISGASFEGFYYICFNQVSGVIEGIYFHAKSEKFQRLMLHHVEDHGCQGAMEFR